MRIRINGTALVGLILVCSTAVARAGAQASDSTQRRWSIFGGTVPTELQTRHRTANPELGAGFDFRTRAFPLPLRATLAFSEMNAEGGDVMMKFGTLSLDAIARPVPKLFGTQLYLLGGGGVGTRAEYTGFTGGSYFATDVAPAPYSFYVRPRQTWTFLEGGAGVELGRMFFQMKLQQPVASEGYTRVPLSIGFRF